MSASCGNCRFYLPQTIVGMAHVRDVGLCRISPPAVVAGEDSDRLWGVWPAVNATDWCGQHHYETSISARRSA